MYDHLLRRLQMMIIKQSHYISQQNPYQLYNSQWAVIIGTWVLSEGLLAGFKCRRGLCSHRFLCCYWYVTRPPTKRLIQAVSASLVMCWCLLLSVWLPQSRELHRGASVKVVQQGRRSAEDRLSATCSKALSFWVSGLWLWCFVQPSLTPYRADAHERY